ncbi:phage tail assembly chaperone G [Oceanobacillus profundus]|uniref:phage tail assembly chaperone G n=1 Tax=Oceanobacillus profundus TaxID=372463 RepID=UPI0026E249B9|nr:hypothetical protein [Oceanobacillus profundus]MDO6451717.1 hypothetical protein [Oceanobacillus profundus]
MQIELYVNGEKKTFTAPFVPMLAKRKYLEIEAKAEERKAAPSPTEQLEEENELFSILADVVFKGQFTVDDIYNGANDEYAYKKLRESVFGKPKTEGNEGNEQGK